MLIVLDLNGCLCFKHNTTEDLDPRLLGSDLIELEMYSVWARPKAGKFVESLLEEHEVAIFSSTTYKNANPMINLILDRDLRKKLKFVWYRERTRLDPDFGIDPEIQSHDTVKMVKDILEDPFINEKRNYSFENVIIADNDFSKIRFNPRKNRVLFPGLDTDLNDFRHLLNHKISILEGTTEI